MCKVTADTTGLTYNPYSRITGDATRTGGRVHGSIRLKVTCDDVERPQPELKLDEEDHGLAAWVWESLGADTIYNKPDVTNTAGKTGFVTIEEAWKSGDDQVGLMVNIVTDSNGTQSFDLNYKCRCQPGGNWERKSVTVSLSMP